MPCRYPLTQYRVGETWTFVEPVSPSLYEQRQLGCGQCAICRSAKSAEHSTRLIHEGLTRPESIAVTCTYADDALPEHRSLRKGHWSAFVKRLRARVAARKGRRFSFDAIGEYSPELMRPHYHGALFDYFPPDGKRWAKSRAGNDEYVSAELSEAWGHGHVTYQHWSAGGARYIAAHQAWKLSGHASEARLLVLDAEGIVVAQREPEFHLCSTRPGIGRGFFERYGEQALRLGFTVARDGAVPLPRYYLRLGKDLYPEAAALALEERREFARGAARLSDERLAVVEECKAVLLARKRQGTIR